MKRGDAIWAIVFCSITAALIVPDAHRIFVEETQAHPYTMAFFKFAVMATMGELLAIRIVAGRWRRTQGLILKAAVWGIVGMLISLMFAVFSGGVAAAEKSGLLFAGNGLLSPLLTAFYISTLMNLTFAPAFMAAHRISDAYIDARAEGGKERISAIIAGIDWAGFLRFVVGRTIPFFWIPAHTVTFLLPNEYRVLAAAYLSIALGAILAYARRREAQG